MSTINSSSVKGFLELKEVKPCPRDQHTKRAFDGRKLDELHIKNMVMTSRKEVKELIEFLEVTKFCFDDE